MSDVDQRQGASQTVFGTKDAIELLIKQTNTANTLWGIYVAVSFTAAGFALTLRSSLPGHSLPVPLSGSSSCISLPGLSFLISVLAALGFGVFLYGHWRMLRASVLVIEAVSRELDAEQARDKGAGGGSFTKSIAVLVDNAYSVNPSGWAHFAIDCCSMGILLMSPWISNAAACLP